LKKEEEENLIKTRLNNIASTLNTQSVGIQNFWNAYGPDNEYGINLGFYGTISRNGTAIQPDSKSLLQISQHMWSYSTLYSYDRTNVGAMTTSQNLFNFLIQSFYQVGEIYGNFYYLVDRNGSTILDDTYHIYAEAFTLLGLGQYYTFNNNEIIQLYFEHLLTDMDYSAHDPVYGGYNATYDPYGNPYSPPIVKDVFSHLVLLEALTFLYQLDPTDDEIHTQLLEVYDLFFTQIVQSQPPYVQPYFAYNWNKVGGAIQFYGVDLETVWAIYQAAEALGFTNDTIQFLTSFGAAASSAGFDNNYGGYFYSGVPGGAANNLTKEYSTQCSSLLGNWQLYVITKDETYLSRMESTITWLSTYQTDSQYGELYEAVVDNGTVVSSTDKGTQTKSSFHDIRATFYLQQQINSYVSSL